MTNAERADRAIRGLSGYAEGPDEWEADAQDFLSDLMHLTHERKADFDDILRMARDRYDEELWNCPDCGQEHAVMDGCEATTL